jgi:hypothetical protein
MANGSHCRCRRVSAQEPPATSREPPVRRWPHSTEAANQTSSRDTAYDIRCALSCQTQLLCEIKKLLEQLAGSSDASDST